MIELIPKLQELEKQAILLKNLKYVIDNIVTKPPELTKLQVIFDNEFNKLMKIRGDIMNFKQEKIKNV